jgi:tRNA threonylcarbamoyladenosine biosynthesis protein TsaB
MALLLSLETSTHAFSCALHEGQRLIAFSESLREQTTASLLTVLIEKLFNDAGLKKDQLDALVVAAGPGSYTGLRIGVATAKGICFALNIPLISVNTLSLVANQFLNQFKDDPGKALLCPMLDARRMEVYCMLCDKNNRVVEAVQAKVIDRQSFAGYLEAHTIYFFGAGSDKCKSSIDHHNARFVADVKPSAALLGVMGFRKWMNREIENTDLFEPLYLKDFVIKKPNLVS